MSYVKSSQSVVMFNYGHRLGVRSIKRTTKSGDGSKARRVTPRILGWGKTNGIGQKDLI
jgi:hypothetical protein